MFAQSRMVQRLCMYLILLVVVAPLQGVQGQEGTEAEGEPTNLPYQVFLPVVQGDATAEGEVVAAFQHGWYWESCTGVQNTEVQHGLWDDLPGAATLNNNNQSNMNEAGLLWFITDSIGDEKCSYTSEIGGTGVSTTRFPKLDVRVAVNDGAKFKIELFDMSGAEEFCYTLITQYTTSSSADDNVLRNLSQITLPPGRNICRVSITLDDDPSTVASRRASALIDYIRIWDGISTSTGIGWNESFGRTD